MHLLYERRGADVTDLEKRCTAIPMNGCWPTCARGDRRRPGGPGCARVGVAHRPAKTGQWQGDRAR